jgi:formate/nitrite transporter FocA (FNT family)
MKPLTAGNVPQCSGIARSSWRWIASLSTAGRACTEPWPELLLTAAAAGTEVALGVLALLAVQQATGSPLLAGLAFSVGFIALLLGHSELFTEGFLVPVTVVAAGEASWW